MESNCAYVLSVFRAAVTSGSERLVLLAPPGCRKLDGVSARSKCMLKLHRIRLRTAPVRKAFLLAARAGTSEAQQLVPMPTPALVRQQKISRSLQPGSEALVPVAVSETQASVRQPRRSTLLEEVPQPRRRPSCSDGLARPKTLPATRHHVTFPSSCGQMMLPKET